MRENKFGQELARLLRSQGALVYPNVASQWGIPGWPDKRVVSVKWDGEMELKSLNGGCSMKQINVLRELDRRLGPWRAVAVFETSIRHEVGVRRFIHGLEGIEGYESFTCPDRQLLDELCKHHREWDERRTT